MLNPFTPKHQIDAYIVPAKLMEEIYEFVDNVASLKKPIRASDTHQMREASVQLKRDLDEFTIHNA